MMKLDFQFMEHVDKNLILEILINLYGILF